MIRRCWTVVSVVALVSVLVEGASHAAPDARELQARQAYAAGRYEDAIELYSQLYAEKLHPVYLRNVARCYQGLGRPERAIASFREYLRKQKSMTAEERAEVEGFIRECEAELHRGTGTVQEPHTDPPPLVPEAGKAQAAVTPTPEPPTKRDEPQPQPPSNPESTTAVEQPTVSVQGPEPVAAAKPPADETTSGAGGAPAGGPAARAYVPGRSAFLAGVSAGPIVSATGGPESSSGFAAAVRFAYDVSANRGTAFQLTAHVGCAFANDSASTLRMVSVLAGPAVSKSLAPRWSVSAALQAGIQVWAGMNRTSALYPPPVQDPEAMTSFSLRGALSVEYQVARALSAFLSPALIFAARPDPNFYNAMLRFEPQLGLLLRL